MMMIKNRHPELVSGSYLTNSLTCDCHTEPVEVFLQVILTTFLVAELV